MLTYLNVYEFQISREQCNLVDPQCEIQDT